MSPPTKCKLPPRKTLPQSCVKIFVSGYRGVNLAWKLEVSWVLVWKRALSWVLKIEQKKACSTGLSVHPRKIVSTYMQILLIMKSTTFGKCSYLIFLYLIWYYDNYFQGGLMASTTPSQPLTTLHVPHPKILGSWPKNWCLCLVSLV